MGKNKRLKGNCITTCIFEHKKCTYFYFIFFVTELLIEKPNYLGITV
jgi:hypothetical protein